MSSCLVQRIERTHNVEVLCNTTILRMLGDDHLTALEIVSGVTGGTRPIEKTALFSYIGAVPRTNVYLPRLKPICGDLFALVQPSPGRNRQRIGAPLARFQPICLACFPPAMCALVLSSALLQRGS
jgi:hypothetical protein